MASTPPDGHTLYMSLATNYIALPELQANFPIDVVRDFVPIGYVGGHPMVVAASADLGVGTLPELIALAKKRKGELNVAAGNRGSILHLTGEWLRSAAGIDVTLLHYASAPQAITDVLGGRVHVMIDAVTSMRGAIDARETQAACGRDRAAPAQDPGPADSGRDHPGLRGGGLARLDGAARHARAARRRISDDLRKVLADPALQKRYEELGTHIRPTTPDELTAFIREQQQIWRPVIAETAKKIN